MGAHYVDVSDHQERLIAQLRENDHAVALRAVELLRKHGWLFDGTLWPLISNCK